MINNKIINIVLFKLKVGKIYLVEYLKIIKKFWYKIKIKINIRKKPKTKNQSVDCGKISIFLFIYFLVRYAFMEPQKRET
jgi:hypothetical protein